MLQQRGRHEEAVEQYLALLKLQPRAADALCNCGRSLMELGRLAEAESLMRRALGIDERALGAWNDLALLHYYGGRHAHAAQLAHEGLRRRDDTDLRNTLGLAHKHLGALDKAEQFFRQAIRLRADNAAAHFNLATLLLAAGSFEEGWKEYAWRPQRLAVRAANPDAKWLAPEDLPALAGKRVELLGEQGLGDEIFLLRFAGTLAARGARLSYRGDPRIRALLPAKWSPGPELPDCVALLGDLPEIVQAAGAEPPLRLAAPEHAVAQARRRLESEGRPPFIGVTWSGGQVADAGQARDRGVLHKRIAPAALGNVLREIEATCVILQRAPTVEDRAAFEQALGRGGIDLSAANEDLERMLATLAALDEHVGVSNTNMHLGAALGKPARVLVQWPPEWRWGAAGEARSWFPGFRLYREAPGGGWDAALAGLSRDLQS